MLRFGTDPAPITAGFRGGHGGGRAESAAGEACEGARRAGGHRVGTHNLTGEEESRFTQFEESVRQLNIRISFSNDS